MEEWRELHLQGIQKAIRLNREEIEELRRLYRLAWEDVKRRLEYLEDLEARLGDKAGHGVLIRATREQMDALESTWRSLEHETGEIYLRAARRAWGIGLATGEAFGAAIGTSFGVVPHEAAVLLQRQVLELAGDVTRELANRIKGEVMRGILSGESVRKVARRVVGRGLTTEGTPFRKAIVRAKTIVRTETVRAFNLATVERYREYDVIVGYQWDAFFDERTCPECAALHGKFWRKGNEKRPPLHPNCRCVLLPVTKRYGEYPI